MKRYLNFTLKGSQFLPVWIAFIFFFMIPYYLLQGEMASLTAIEVSSEGPSKLFFIYLLCVVSMAFVFLFYMVKLVVQSLEYNGVRLSVDYHPNKYIGIVITGIMLSIISLGIYIPWFIRNLHRFFVHGVVYNFHKFAFRGKGGRLFLTLTLTIFIPFLVLGIILFSILNSNIDLWIYQIIVMFALAPNIYLIYKWLVDIRYKNYMIKWDTKFFPATGRIAGELVLAVLTLGIYFPMAYLRLYRYFTQQTKSNIVDGKQVVVGYDGYLWSDFLFIWGQILLMIVTLGIYYPWAFSRIIRRVLNQTYLSTLELSIT
jgi:tetrahydromethanopterin S-methyltransferase subunit F